MGRSAAPGTVTSETTTSGVKTDVESFIRDLQGTLGGKTEETLTLDASGTTKPTTGVVQIRSNIAGSADELDILTPEDGANVDGLADGRPVLLRAGSASEPITVKNGFGGTGQILTVDGADVVLDATDKWLLLVRRGTSWIEYLRGFGSDLAAARAYLGLTSIATTSDPVASDAGKALVVSDGGVYQLTGPLVQPNLFLNGDMAIDQRHGGALVTNPNGYVVDGWRVNVQNADGGVGSAQRVAFAPGDASVSEQATHYLEVIMTSGTATLLPTIESRIESVTVLAGGTVVVQMELYVSANIILSAHMTQFFGSTGSAAVNTATQYVALIGGIWQYKTLVFTLPSISGKTVSGGDDYLSFVLEAPVGYTGTLRATWLKGEPGSYATAFTPERRWEAVRRCKREFTKSYDIDVVPGSVAPAGPLSAVSSGTGAGAVEMNPQYDEMRNTPSVVIYAQASGNAGFMTDYSGGTVDVAAAAIAIGTRGFRLYNNAAVTTAHLFNAQYTADASL